MSAISPSTTSSSEGGIATVPSFSRNDSFSFRLCLKMDAHLPALFPGGVFTFQAQPYERVVDVKRKFIQLLVWDNNQDANRLEHGADSMKIHFVKGFRDIQLEDNRTLISYDIGDDIAQDEYTLIVRSISTALVAAIRNAGLFYIFVKTLSGKTIVISLFVFSLLEASTVAQAKIKIKDGKTPD